MKLRNINQIIAKIKGNTYAFTKSKLIWPEQIFASVSPETGYLWRSMCAAQTFVAFQWKTTKIEETLILVLCSTSVGQQTPSVFLYNSPQNWQQHLILKTSNFLNQENKSTKEISIQIWCTRRVVNVSSNLVMEYFAGCPFLKMLQHCLGF